MSLLYCWPECCLEYLDTTEIAEIDPYYCTQVVGMTLPIAVVGNTIVLIPLFCASRKVYHFGIVPQKYVE